MQCSHLLLTCTRQLLSNSLKCSLHTGQRSLSRRVNSGRRHRMLGRSAANVMDEDTDENFWEEEESPESFDFMNVDRAYDDHERETRHWQKRVDFKMVEQKFFKEAKQPLMLTYNEKMCIKHLHEKDPVHWSVKALAEGFPASPEVIQKVLRARPKLSPEEIQKMDKRVEKNWKLLEEGKLEARPDVLEHLKKFVNRRHVLLEQLKSDKFYLPEVKKTKTWNNGEMNRILESYEKQLTDLEKNRQPALESGKTDLALPGNTQEKLSSSDIVQEKIQRVRNSLSDDEDRDSFKIGKVVSKFSNKSQTYEDLENELMQAYESNQKLNVLERAIVESKLRKRNLEGFSNARSDMSDRSDRKVRSEDKSSQVPKFRKTEQTDLLLRYDAVEVDESGTHPRKSDRASHDPSRMVQNDDDKYDRYLLESPYTKMMKNVHNVGDTTKVHQHIHDLSRSLHGYPDQLEPATPKAVQKFEEQMNDPEEDEKDRQHFENEENDLKRTAFWNGRMKSEEKRVMESQKRPLACPDDPHKSDSVQIFRRDTYPQRIKIPIDKRGSGLTFKVRDCYYDDDGEFLYRVPGMVK